MQLQLSALQLSALIPRIFPTCTKVGCGILFRTARFLAAWAMYTILTTRKQPPTSSMATPACSHAPYQHPSDKSRNNCMVPCSCDTTVAGNHSVSQSELPRKPSCSAVWVDTEVCIHDRYSHRLEVLNEVIKYPEPIWISAFSDLHTNTVLLDLKTGLRMADLRRQNATQKLKYIDTHAQTTLHHAFIT